MSAIYELNTLAAYSAATKITAAGHSQEWDATKSLVRGGAGSAKFNIAATTGSTYVEGSFTQVATPYFFSRFYADAAGLSIASGKIVTVGTAVNVAVSLVSIVQFNNLSGVLNLQSYVMDDTGAYHHEDWPVSEAIQFIEIRTYKASDGATADGRQELWVNKILRTTVSNVLLYTRFTFNKFRLGPAGVTTDAGVMWLGDLVVTDDGAAIGPYVPHNTQAFNQLRRRRRLSS